MILVTEAIIHTKKKYIIVISGLDKDIVNDICLEMAQVLKYTYLSFLDNSITDDSKNYNNIFYRVEELLKIKPQGIIISLLSYPDKYTMIDVKLHINLAINQTYFYNIKKKYGYLDDLFLKYDNILKNNKVHKYINIKLDSDLNQIKHQCFNTIITSIEKAYYGTNYDKVLQYRNDNNSDNSDNSDNGNYNKPDNSNKKFNNYNSKRNSKKSVRDSSDSSDKTDRDSRNSSKKLFRSRSKLSRSSEKSDSDSSNSSDSSDKSFSSNSSVDQYLNFDNDSD
jgi:hypothetical protein